MQHDLDAAQVTRADAARAAELTAEQLDQLLQLVTPWLSPSMAPAELLTLRQVMVLAAAEMLQEAGYRPEMAVRAACAHAHAFRLDRTAAQCLRVAQVQDGGDRLLVGELRADGTIVPDLDLMASIVLDLAVVEEEILEALLPEAVAA
jgi:hypothetical protein